MGKVFGGGGGGGGMSRKAVARHVRAAKSSLSRYGQLAREQLERGKGELSAGGQLEQLYGQGLARFGGLDQDIAQRRQQALEANIGPLQEQMREQLGTRFAGFGPAGRRSSRGQFALARYGRELADTSAQRLANLQAQAEQQAIQSATGRTAPIFGLQGQNVGLTRGLAQQLASTGQQLAGADMSAAGMANQAAMQQAQMAAQGRSQAKGGVGNLIGGGISLAGSLFSDRRLKENIKPVGKLDNGLTIYSYNFKGSDTPEIGLIAQEVEEVRPQAVFKDRSGYLKVNYAEASR